MSESRQNSGVGDDGHESEEDGDEEREESVHQRNNN